MALPLGILALFSGLGALGLYAVASSKNSATATPSTPGTSPDLSTPSTTTTTKTPGVATTKAPTGLTPAGELFDALGQQATVALKALGYNSAGVLTGTPTAEAVQAATSLAALMEANGFSAQAAQLREMTKAAAAKIAVPPCDGVPAILPAEIGKSVCRALTLERDPTKLRAIAQALRGLPQSSDPQVVALIKLLETSAAQLEAQQSEADTQRKIAEVLASKTPGVMPEPIPEDKYSPPTLPAELQALVDAALKGMGVDGGIVKGPVTQDGLVAARQAIEVVTLNGFPELAAQLRYYLMIAEKMAASSSTVPASTTIKPATATAATYTVKSGDTGVSIAKKFTGDGNRWKELKAANPAIASRPDPKGWGMVIYAGDVLKLPTGWPSTPGAVAVVTTTAVPVATPAALPAATTTSVVAPVSTGPKTYTVKSGDTGSGIAKAFTGDASRWVELKALNPKVMARAASKQYGFAIYVGDVINIPADW